ncbi:hypothetical protein AB2L28_17075 [Kineococcus sp. TBRC 1896]|uniref:Uncharacterized protein n=1 Tax=Kineococcus mangrovi TaxID=1660183 RepID=A0ABV4I5Z5_9ACTN
MNVTTERVSTGPGPRTGLDAELDRLLAAAPSDPVRRRTTPPPLASPLCLCWPAETDE